MPSTILILASVILSLVIASLLFKKFKVLSPFDKENKQNLFMSKEESIKHITERAELTDEESVGLDVLFDLVSGIRLHQAFEDEEISKKWLTTARRAIAKSEQFDHATKEELEYTAYEIHRKIDNRRKLLHPSIKKTSDITLGQIMDIKYANGTELHGELIETNFYSLSILIDEQEDSNVKPLKFNKKKVSVSFWKEMDARYKFNTSITTIEKNKKNIILHLSLPKEIVCVQIRSHPRQHVEIPTKFRQGTLSTDSDTGALQEDFSGIIFGIINNIGPWGCSIISHIPILENTIVIIELPLFNQLSHIKGIVRNVINHSKVFTLHIEFNEDTTRHNTLQIYHYIFAEDTSN